MRRTPLLVAAIVMASCATPPTSDGTGMGAAPVRAEVGNAFELRVGQEATVGETEVRIRFEGVRQDSRCPAGVTCVWAGDAEVALRILTDGGSTEVLLHTGVEPRSANVAGYLIRLTDVQPHPVEGRSTPPGTYIASLVVSG